MKGFFIGMYFFIALLVGIAISPSGNPEDKLWLTDTWGEAVGVGLLWPLFAFKFLLMGIWWVLVAIGHGGALLFS